MRWPWIVSAMIHAVAIAGSVAFGTGSSAPLELRPAVAISIEVIAEPFVLYGADRIISPERAALDVEMEILREPVDEVQEAEDPEELLEDVRLSPSHVSALDNEIAIIPAVGPLYASTESETDRPVPLSGNPPPRYPAFARQRGIEGTVVVLLVVSWDGKVIQVEIIESSGSRLLDRAALSALSRWRFKPVQSANGAGKYTLAVPIRFKLVAAR